MNPSPSTGIPPANHKKGEELLKTDEYELGTSCKRYVELVDQFRKSHRDYTGLEAFDRDFAELTKRQDRQVQRYNMAEELKKTGETETAIALYEINVTEGCDAPASYENLADLFHEAERREDEIRILRRAVQVFEEVVRPGRGHGQTQLDSFRLRLAGVESGYFANVLEIEALWKVLVAEKFSSRQHKDQLWGLCQKGMALTWKWRSVVETQEASSTRARNLPCYTRAIMLLEKEGRVGQAVVLCDQALHWAPDEGWYVKKKNSLAKKHPEPSKR
jgi:tetratricopeptide (TPR) repeat protein